MSKAAELAALIGSQTALSNRNMVINGAMQVAQRGTSAVTVTTSADYRTVDRWKSDIDGSSGHDWSHEQSTDAPDGFDYSSKITVVTNGSQPSGTSDRHQFYYQAEAQDLNSLAWGTSSAKSATLSFWVKSSVTGIFGCKFNRYTTSDTQYYNTSYTVNSAGVWEYKTITLPPITSLDRVASGNSVGILLEFAIGYSSGYEGSSVQDTWQTSTDIEVPSGTVYLPATSGATWQITGVQLEVGEQATPFEHRSYGDELARCQRYYYRWGFQDALSSSGTIPIQTYGTAAGGIDVWNNYPTEMRARPTITTNGTWSTSNVSSFSGRFQNRQGFSTRYDVSSDGSAYIYANSVDDYFEIDAEL